MNISDVSKIKNNDNNIEKLKFNNLENIKKNFEIIKPEVMIIAYLKV